MALKLIALGSVTVAVPTSNVVICVPATLKGWPSVKPSASAKELSPVAVPEAKTSVSTSFAPGKEIAPSVPSVSVGTTMLAPPVAVMLAA